MANRVQIKRGNQSTMPPLADGELAFCRDTGRLFIGDGTNHRQVCAPYGEYAYPLAAGATTGSGQTFLLSPNPAVAAYKTGMTLVVDFTQQPESGATLDISGLGARPLLHADGTQNLNGAVASGLHTIRYDGIGWRVLDISPNTPYLLCTGSLMQNAALITLSDSVFHYQQIQILASPTQDGCPLTAVTMPPVRVPGRGWYIGDGPITNALTVAGTVLTFSFPTEATLQSVSGFGPSAVLTAIYGYK